MVWLPKSPYERNKVEVNLNLDNYVTQKEFKSATGVDTSGFTQKTDFDKLKADVKKLQDKPHTTDEDTKKELVDLRANLAAHKRKLEKDLKALDDKIKTGTGSSTGTAKKDLDDVKKSINDQKILVDEAIIKLDDRLKKLKLTADNNSASILSLENIKAQIDTKLTKTNSQLKSVEDNKVDKKDFNLVKLASDNNDISIQSLKNAKTSTDTKLVLLDKAIKDNKIANDKAIGDINKKITKIDDKIKIGPSPTDTLDNHKFLLGRAFFTGTDGYQNTLVFSLTVNYFVFDSWTTGTVKVWKSSGVYPDVFIKAKDSSYPALKMDTIYNTIDFEFNKSYMYGTRNINAGSPSIYVVYEFFDWSPDFGNTHAFHNCLFGATDKNYKGRGIAFDSQTTWTHADGSTARNVIIFGTKNAKSRFPPNKDMTMTTLGKNYISGLAKGKTLIAEKMFDINFTKPKKKFVMSVHYNGPLSYLYVNGKQIYQFTASVHTNFEKPLCLGVISKDFPKKEAQEVALSGKIYDFSVDFRVPTSDEIKNIHEYLMKKHIV